MQKQRDSKVSALSLQNSDKMPQQADKQHINFFQNSKLLVGSNINSDSFGCLNSFFFRDCSPDPYNLSLFSRIQCRQTDNYSYFQDQSQVQVLTFGRGYSEEFHLEDKQFMIEGDKIYGGQFGNDVVSTSIVENMKIDHIKGETERDYSGQELQSNSINSQSNINAESPQSHSESLCTGLLVKNVTKNIGKLLFKYIWKNRIALRRVIKADQAVWERLMCMIRACKKQNNVTREFLISRFHGEGEECSIFRVLAHHFFRKHCLAAIFRSKIKAKRIHFERIKKFDQALTNVRALDYLA